MAQADHDYKGHRVKAMHKVHAAVVALRNGAKGGKNPVKIVKGGNLPQAESDALLKKAMDQITSVQGQLASVQDGRASTAVVELKAAVEELKTALAIR
jgi:hypothetical protein